MRETDRFVVPALGVAVIIAVFVLGTAGFYSIGYVAILFVLGLAAIGTYFVPEQVQVETRAAIAVLGLIVLIFMFSSLGFWLALLAFGTIGALQFPHRGTFQIPPHTYTWLNDVLAQRRAAGTTAGADDEAVAPAQPAEAVPTETSGSGLMGKAGIGGIAASALGIIILCTAVMPWFELSFDGSEARSRSWSAWELVQELRAEDGDSPIPYGIAGATMALALLAGASLVLPRWAPAVVGVAGLAVMIFTYIYVAGVLRLDEIPDEVEAGFGVGFWLASLAFILVAGLQLIPRPNRSSG